MHIDASQSPVLFELASERLGGTYRHDWNQRILSAIVDGKVAAQAVLTNICPGVKCELSMWVEREHGLAGRQFLRQLFYTAFIDLKCKRVHAVTRMHNPRARATLEKMGFVPEANLERWFDDDHGVMFKMLLPDCRWLKESRNGR